MTRSWCLFIVGTFVTLSDIATGQSTTASQSIAATDTSLEEIVVTATRRETNLQTTPIAVSAISNNFIESHYLEDLGSMAQFVPNFSAATIAGFNAASFAMRGVGQNSIIVYFESPVSVLVDDFVVSSVQTQLLDTFDIDQVEVLRGPQGTLFGKNTTGGAVSVRTRRPVLGEFGAEGRVTVGNFGTKEVRGAFNVPLGETLAFRFVGVHEKSDGYMRGCAPFGPIQSFVPSEFAGLSGRGDCGPTGGVNVFNGRAKLLWKPSDNFSALLQYESLRDRSESPSSVNTTPRGDPYYLFNLVGFPQGTGNPLYLGSVANRSGFFINQGNGQTIDVDGEYLNLAWNVGPGTINSITGYRRQYSSLPTNITGLPAITAPNGDQLSILDFRRDDLRKTFQEEVRFSSSFNGPFRFVAGGFYQHETIQFAMNGITGIGDVLGGTTPYGPINQNPYLIGNRQRSISSAVFAETNYDATDRFTLTAGVRYTWEHKKFEARQAAYIQELLGPGATVAEYEQLGRLLDISDFGRFPQGVIRDEHSWHDPTYRFSASYKISDDIFSYATYSTGFKSGGYNDEIGLSAPYGTNLAAFHVAAQPTNPEKAKSIEAGVKSEFYDHRVRMNLTGFYVKYSELQRQLVLPVLIDGVPAGNVTTYFNAAAAHVSGLEAEAAIIPVAGLTLRGVLGIENGKYDKYVTPIPAGYNLASSPLDRTPKMQWTLDSAYKISIGQLGSLTFDATVSHVDSNLFAQAISRPQDNTYLNAHTLVDASISLNSADDKLFLRFVGRNLTNKVYETASLDIANLMTASNFAPPRFFAVEFGFRLGSR